MIKKFIELLQLTHSFAIIEENPKINKFVCVTKAEQIILHAS